MIAAIAMSRGSSGQRAEPPGLELRGTVPADEFRARIRTARVFAAECELYPQVINWIADGLVRSSSSA